jgi:hypothetical protein
VRLPSRHQALDDRCDAALCSGGGQGACDTTRVRKRWAAMARWLPCSMPTEVPLDLCGVTPASLPTQAHLPRRRLRLAVRRQAGLQASLGPPRTGPAGAARRTARPRRSPAHGRQRQPPPPAPRCGPCTCRGSSRARGSGRKGESRFPAWAAGDGARVRAASQCLQHARPVRTRFPAVLSLCDPVVAQGMPSEISHLLLGAILAAQLACEAALLERLFSHSLTPCRVRSRGTPCILAWRSTAAEDST